MAILINGNGNQAIYAAQDADWYASIFGGNTAITGIGYQFAADLLDANTIGVKDGVIITQEGRRIQIDANAIDTFDIPTGAQGTTNYYIIGYHLVTGTQSEQTCETFVRLMANSSETIPEGTFRGGDDDIYISLYRVTQDDLTITDIDLLLPKVSSITELNQHLTANSKTMQMSYVDGKYGITIDGTFYELGGGGVKSIQRGDFNVTFTTSSQTGSRNVTISSVDTSKAVVICNGAFTSVGTAGNSATSPVITGRLTDSTTLALDYSGLGVANGVSKFDWQVIEFK